MITENKLPNTLMRLPKFPRWQSLALYASYFLMGVGLGVIGGFYIARATTWCVATTLSAGDGNTTEVPLTTPRITLPLTDEEKINLQENKLRSIECEPKPVVEKIVRYLEYHDDLADREHYPEVITVNRCLENSSFCGDPRFGKSYGPCLPDPGAIKQLSVSVFYNEGRKKIFKEVLVPEHTACKCPDK